MIQLSNEALALLRQAKQIGKITVHDLIAHTGTVGEMHELVDALLAQGWRWNSSSDTLIRS